MPYPAEEDLLQHAGRLEVIKYTMLQDQYIWQMAEAALAGTLTPAQKQELDARIVADDAFAQAYNESLNLLQSLDANGQQRRFRNTLKEIHQQVTAPAEKKTRTFRFNPAYLRTAAMAAGIALFTSLTTIWTMKRGDKKEQNHIMLLGGEINRIKQSQQQQQQLIQNIKNKQETPVPATEIVPSNYSGTGFALTNDGYLITNYHVTDGADSIYILTRNGGYYKARVIAFEPKTDVAILKVEDKKFRFGKGEIPYTFATSKAALGTRIYTLGFPQNEIVYNEGYISSRNGYEGDSIQYRLEVTAAPGQSGAPVLDNAGNVVGLIKGKDNESNSTTYAVSSKALLRLLHDLDANGIHLPKVNKLSTHTREQQVEKLQDYTCMIQVYKN